MKTGNTFFAMAVIAILGITTISCGNDDTHTHAYSAAWQTNETQHWKECSCGEKNETANHTFDSNGICMCGYEQAQDWAGVGMGLSFTNATAAGVNLTHSEWNGVSGKIKAAINKSVDNAPTEPVNVQQILKDRFAKCENIFVEKTTVYPTWKTNGDGKTIYINFGLLDNEDLWSIINNALASMNMNKEEQGE
jgi:hypothetical protein